MPKQTVLPSQVGDLGDCRLCRETVVSGGCPPPKSWACSRACIPRPSAHTPPYMQIAAKSS